MSNTYKLYEAVLASSESQIFEEARFEWYVSDYKIVDDEDCVCGKEHIKHIYTIKNIKTKKTLLPIGSRCIKKFDRDDLLEEMNIIGHKYTIFKNKNKKHDGETYGYICECDPKYVEFLMSNGKKKVYEKLVKYYTHINKL